MQIKEIIFYLESIAPRAYQESYDNSGLIVGYFDTEITGILTTLDVTEDVVNEAIALNINLIIAHHPIIFKGLKKLNGSNYVERTVIKAIKNDIAIYAIHTNLDNVKGGVNFKIAEKLGLKNVRILVPKKELLRKITVFVPKQNTDQLIAALHKAGAGSIGNYTDCSFRTEGIGTFKPNDEANPAIGKANTLESVTENRVEMIFPLDLEGNVIKAMYQTHPYEEVSYHLSTLENESQDIGSGAIGDLDWKGDVVEFLKNVKSIFNVPTIKHTKLKTLPIAFETKLKTLKIAVCGGSGSFLLYDAVGQGAAIFISSDFKYHEYFDADNRIVIADIGHYESEQYTKDLLYEIISNKFPNIAVLLSKTNTNPVHYL